MNDLTLLSENEKRLLGALGMSARARKMIFGVPMICDALAGQRRTGKYPLIVFEAADTSENTHKRISDRCGYYGVKLIRLKIDGATLAATLGKSASLAAVALTDENFVRLAESYL